MDPLDPHDNPTGERPSTNKPLFGPERARVTPAFFAGGLLLVILVIFVVLFLL